MSLLIPAPLLPLPYLMVASPALHHQQPWDAVLRILSIPAVPAMFYIAVPLRINPLVAFALAGVYWYLLGVLLLSAMLGRRDRFLRTITVIVIVLTALILAGGTMLSGWNPD